MDESRKKKARKTSQFAEIWHRLKKNKMAMAGLYILLFILVASLFGPLISIYQYDVQDYAVRSQFPSLSHLFGTDNFGRDILTRIMVGGRYTLFIALVCVTSSAIIGSLLGLIAAYYSDLRKRMVGGQVHLPGGLCRARGGSGRAGLFCHENVSDEPD